VSPLDALLDALRAARDAGQPFADTWPAAVIAATAGLGEWEARQWRGALDATRGAWEAAYERQPAEREHGAVARLADPEEREALPAGCDRSCERCDVAITARPANARYCSARCQRAATKRTAVAA